MSASRAAKSIIARRTISTSKVVKEIKEVKDIKEVKVSKEVKVIKEVRDISKEIRTEAISREDREVTGKEDREKDKEVINKEVREVTGKEDRVDKGKDTRKADMADNTHLRLTLTTLRTKPHSREAETKLSSRRRFIMRLAIMQRTRIQ